HQPFSYRSSGLLKCRDREPHHRNFQYSNSCSRAPAMHVQSHLELDANQMPALDEVSRTTSGARMLSESAKDGKIGTSHQCILHDYVFPALKTGSSRLSSRWIFSRCRQITSAEITIASSR